MSTRWIDYAGYANCILIDNGYTQVVLGPHCGGRVLAYSQKGQNALWLSPEHDGLTRETVSDPLPLLFPSGGRCDIGPEQIIPDRPELWLGPWQAEILDDRTARMTSVASPTAGVRLERLFALDQHSSRLTYTQTVHNVGPRQTRWCHWGRTFGRGHGICVVPLTPELTRYPQQYVMYGPGRAIQLAPQDPAIRQRDGYLEVFDTPANPKLGLDSYAGWFAYLMPGDQLFVKRFPTYPERIYNEVAGLTISLWYYRDLVCELEPIGPMEILAPGQSSAFSEEWFLADYAFPQQREALDLPALAQFAQSL